MFSHVLLDPSFLLRLSVSVVTHLEKLSSVFSCCKSKTWKCIHIKLPSQRRLTSAVWCRQGCSLAPQVACVLPHTSTWNHHTILHSSLSPPACGVFFFLIHVQQVPSIPKHVPRSFSMSAVKLKRDFLNLIDQAVTNLARSHLLDTNQIAAAESSCWVSSVLLASWNVERDNSTAPDWASPGMLEGHRALSTIPSWELDLLLQLPLPTGSHNFPR